MFALCLLMTVNLYSQRASLLIEKTLKVEPNLLRKAKHIEKYPSLLLDSITVIPLVSIYPEGKGWSSQVYDSDYEYRVLLCSNLNEIVTWSIKNPNDGEEVVWIIKDAIWETKNVLFSAYKKDVLQAMIDFVGKDKKLYFVYFFPKEIESDLPVIGYVEKNQDVFVDSQLCKHVSLKSLLTSRYGSVDRYRELYDVNKALVSYDRHRSFSGSNLRLISKSHTKKEVVACVEKYKIRNIWGRNVKDTIYLQSGRNAFSIIFYNKGHVLYQDMARNETRLGELKEMDGFYFYGIDYRGNYDKGNCNE